MTRYEIAMSRLYHQGGERPAEQRGGRDAPTNPTITASLRNRQPSSSSSPLSSHSNLFADITLKLQQKYQIDSCIMKPKNDEWHFSSSDDIFIGIIFVIRQKRFIGKSILLLFIFNSRTSPLVDLLFWFIIRL